MMSSATTTRVMALPSMGSPYFRWLPDRSGPRRVLWCDVGLDVRLDVMKRRSAPWSRRVGGADGRHLGDDRCCAVDTHDADLLAGLVRCGVAGLRRPRLTADLDPAAV